jgi:hypothetical protein
VGQHGACWAYVKAYFPQFIYGRYPEPERWRVDIVFVLLAAGLIPMLIPSLPYKKINAIFLLLRDPISVELWRGVPLITVLFMASVLRRSAAVPADGRDHRQAACGHRWA